MKLHRLVVACLVAVLAVSLSSGVALAAKPVPTGKVNINTASADQLTTLPGIGPKLAARIVEHRQKSGTFKSTQELMNVQGIGEKNFQSLQSYLTVGDGGAKAAVVK